MKSSPAPTLPAFAFYYSTEVYGIKAWLLRYIKLTVTLSWLLYVLFSKNIYDVHYNYGEFAIIKSQSGLNSFKISVKEFVAKTNAIRILSFNTGKKHSKSVQNMKTERTCWF